MAFSTLAVDSKGHCFFCLDKITTVKLEILAPGTEPSDRLEFPKYSIQYLSRFLQLDMEKVLNGMHHLTSPSLAGARKSRLTVELCEECNTLNGRLSELCRQLEKLEMEVGSCLGLLHGKFSTAGIDTTERLRDLMVGDNDANLDSLELLEKIRAATFKKCSQKLKADKFRVKIQKVTTNDKSTIVNELGSTQSAAVIEDDSADADETETAVVVAAITDDENGIIQQASVSVDATDAEILTGDVDADHLHDEIVLPGKGMSDHGRNTKTMKKKRTSRRKKGLETRGDTISSTEIPHSSVQKSMNKATFRIPRTKPDNEVICYAVEDRNLKVDRKKTLKGSQKLRPGIPRGQIEKMTTNDTSAEKPQIEAVVGGAVAVINDEGKGTTQLTTFNEEDSLDPEVVRGNVDHSDKIELRADRIIDVQNPKVLRKMRTRSQNKGPETRGDTKLLAETPYANVNSKKKPEKRTFPRLVKTIQPKSKTEVGAPVSFINLETGKRKCGTCSLEFSTREGFHRHYRSVHLQIRFKCVTCGKQFARRQDCNRHQKSAHVGVRFSCLVCKKSYTQTGNLWAHQQTTDCGKTLGLGLTTKKHDCQFCGKSFYKKGDLKDHLDGVHFKSGEFSCNICDKKFNFRTSLSKHRRGVHSGTLT